MGQVTRKPQAVRDLIEQATYIAEDNPEAAERFLAAAETAFDQLAQMPRLGALQRYGSSRLSGIRKWRVPGFRNQLIFYRETEAGVDIIRVLHGARDIDAIIAEGTAEGE